MLRDRWPLFALCAGLSVAEALTLQVTGFRSALPLAPQLAAPGSLGAYHDLRWVFTYHWSWASLAWQLAALVVVRTLVTVGIVWFGWPTDAERPRFWTLVRRNAGATVIAVVALSPWAVLAFAAQVMAFSWFMILSIVASFVTMLVLPLAVTGRWWRRLVLWRAVGWLVVGWLALTVEALAISLSPGWVAVLTAFGAGLVDALVWLALVRTTVHARTPERAWPLAPVAIVLVLAVFLVGGGHLVGSASSQAAGSSLPRAGAVEHAGRPVLYVSGFGTSYDGGRFRLFDTDRLATWRYSYRGLGPRGPRAYAPRWTHQAVGVSAHKLAVQVRWLHARTGRRLALVADSEGVLVTRLYLERHPDAPVSHYVMASPLPRPARVFFPPPGKSGWGMAAGWEARELLRMLRLENSRFGLQVDLPLVRSVTDRGGRFRSTALCPVGPRVRTYAFIPLSGATVVYHGPVSHVRWSALPGWHASLLPRQTVAHDVERLLTTGAFTHHDASTAAFRVIYGAASAWQVPALPLHLRPGWHAPPHTDPAFADWHCPS